ncbi:hypothetical protein GJAV_G00105920, partial [Gymnothorax javanicus]
LDESNTAIYSQPSALRCVILGQHVQLAPLSRTANILEASSLPRGTRPRRLFSTAVRKFAYELAKNIGLKTPCSWKKNQMAGKDWLTSFLERNKTLSIRRPQATSMSRSTSFNKTNVTAFFNNLKTVLTRYNFEANDIWNMDET